MPTPTRPATMLTAAVLMLTGCDPNPDGPAFSRAALPAPAVAPDTPRPARKDMAKRKATVITPIGDLTR